MTVYLCPNLKSKKAFKESIASGKTINAVQLTPWGEEEVKDGKVAFSGPHHPEPHRFYGHAVVRDRIVVKVS